MPKLNDEVLLFLDDGWIGNIHHRLGLFEFTFHLGLNLTELLVFTKIFVGSLLGVVDLKQKLVLLLQELFGNFLLLEHFVIFLHHDFFELFVLNFEDCTLFSDCTVLVLVCCQLFFECVTFYFGFLEPQF